MLNLIYKKDKSPLSRIKSITIPVYANQNYRYSTLWIMKVTIVNTQHSLAIFSDELKLLETNEVHTRYKLGYSNFAFELWLILHKRICNFSVEDRSKYVQNINTLYGTDFTKLKDNKNKENL